jgi:hypothetical protein
MSVARAVLALGLAAGGGFIGYARFVEPRRLRLARRRVPVPGLPAAFAGLRVLHLSDIHVGAPHCGAAHVRAAAAALPADLIAITGDLVHGTATIPACLEVLGQLRAPLGVWAVLGNHDYSYPHCKVDTGALLSGLREIGVRVLDNCAVPIRREAGHVAGAAGSSDGATGESVLWLVGVDDPHRRRHDLGAALRDVARLIKARSGLAAAAVDCGDWDMHDGLGTVAGGRMKTKLTELGAALAAFAERAAIPLLAEPLSGARRGPAAVAHYDALLRDPGWGLAPELVVRVGDLPTSKPLRQWLAGLDGALQVSFDPEAAWQDPGGAVATVLAADARGALEALTDALPRRRDPAWLEAWRRADRAAAHAIAATLTDLSEPRVAAELGVRLPADATLVVASSMPVRDVETFFPARSAPPRVLANRGANGIDGTVSTAFGVAAASGGPVVLLTGDVALAHDVGGLLAASRLGLRLTIVLLDNDGGGIFEFLPVSREGADYVEHVATPHGLDFAHAAALYGCGWERAQDPEGFRAALDRALGAERTTIVCVRTDRADNVAVHRRVWDAVRAGVRSRG